MRSAIAEVHRFPELSRDVNEMARKRATANVAELLSQLARPEKIEQSDAFSADPTFSWQSGRHLREMVPHPVQDSTIPGCSSRGFFHRHHRTLDRESGCQAGKLDTAGIFEIVS